MTGAGGELPAAGAPRGRPSSSRPGRGERPQGRLVGAERAAEELGVPYTTLRDLVFNGLLQVVRFGKSRRWWIDRRDLELLVERSKVRFDQE